MAILKVNERKAKSRVAQYNMLSYVGKKARLTFGYDCRDNWKEANEDFQFIQKFCQSLKRENSRYAQHWVLSYERENNSAEKTLEMAKEFIEKTLKDKNVQVFIAVHTDNNNSIHAHLIVNNVDRFGKKLQTTKAELNKYKKVQNEIARQHGMKVLEIGKTKANKDKKISTWKKEDYYVQEQILKFKKDLKAEVESQAREKLDNFDFNKCYEELKVVTLVNAKYKKSFKKSLDNLFQDKQFIEELEKSIYKNIRDEKLRIKTVTEKERERAEKKSYEERRKQLTKELDELYNKIKTPLSQEEKQVNQEREFSSEVTNTNKEELGTPATQEKETEKEINTANVWSSRATNTTWGEKQTKGWHIPKKSKDKDFDRGR